MYSFLYCILYGIKRQNNEKGVTMVFFAVALTVIAAIMALTIDVGAAMLDKSKMSSAVDAAALAGVQALVSKTGNESSIINNYIAKNISKFSPPQIQIINEQKTVTVKCSKKAENFFLEIFGTSMGDINASATAKAENIKKLDGTRPLAVVQQVFQYGTQYILKEGGGDGNSGNYAAMALGGNGGSVYRDNLLQGYPGTISVGNKIPTETGNIAGTTVTSITQLLNQCTHSPRCTYNSYNQTCSRIIFIPVVNTLDINGKKHVQVLGFATFFLEGVTSHAGKADVVGRFITYCMEGETSNEINDYGTYGIMLVK